MLHLKGTYTALVTPFDVEENLDVEDCGPC